MGEREFNLVALRELIAKRALDLWQPDILRLGSVEAWRDLCGVGSRAPYPCAAHYYKEYDVPLLMTIPNAFGTASFD